MSLMYYCKIQFKDTEQLPDILDNRNTEIFSITN